MYKEDFLAIGGHDELFAPQSKEDSDLFNRFVLKGYNVIQSWDGLVYHFTSRGSRFNNMLEAKLVRIVKNGFILLLKMAETSFVNGVILCSMMH
jgi:hypothetical protein